MVKDLAVTLFFLPFPWDILSSKGKLPPRSERVMVYGFTYSRQDGHVIYLISVSRAQG